MSPRFSRGFSRPLRQGQRRATSWVASADVTAVTNLVASGVILAQSLTEGVLGGLGLLPSTIVRTRGELWVKSDQLAATRVPFGAMGIGVVQEQARVAGVGSLPTPITEEQSELWFVHQFFAANLDFVTAAGVMGSEAMARYSFDSKSMRKIQEGEAVVVVLENAAVTGGVNFIVKFRMLFKLP